MTPGDGIIHTFQQRRNLEDALFSLAGATSESALLNDVRRLANSYPPAMLLSAVLRHLGTPNSQLRGALGHLSALLPVEATAPALRSVVADRHKRAQERTTAALILERYLGEPSPYALLADLAGDEDVPMQSLREAIEASQHNRHILLEYVTQMQEHPVDTAFMVLRLIDRLPPADRVELLRLIAQDARPQVGHAAVDRLAALAATNEGSAALRALYTLALTLPKEEGAAVERALRKLQFAGRRYQSPPATNWRALISPSDPGGYITLWVVRQPVGEQEPSAGAGILLGFVLSLQAGILQFSGAEEMAPAYLPQVQPIGAMAHVGGESGHGTVLLEVPFVVGRWLAAEALAVQHSRNKAWSLPGEYALYNDLLWQFEVPHLPDEVNRWWERSAPAAVLPRAGELADAATALAPDPAMASWVRWGQAVWESAQPPRRYKRDLAGGALVNLLLRELGRTPEHGNLRQAMAAGLRKQTLWFALAGQPEQAARAAQLASVTPVLPIAENPLLAVLLEAGLRRLVGHAG